MGFSRYIREFFGRNFAAFPSFAAMVFSHPGGAFSQEQEQQQQEETGRKSIVAAAAAMVFSHPGSSFCSSSSRRKQEEKVAKSILFYLWVSEVTLGSFWAQF